MKSVRSLAAGLLAVLLLFLFAPAAQAATSEGNESFTVKVGEEEKLHICYLNADYENMTAEITDAYNTEILGTLSAEMPRGESTYDLYIACRPAAVGTATFTVTYTYILGEETYSLVRHCTVTVEEAGPTVLGGALGIKIAPELQAGKKLSAVKAVCTTDHVNVTGTSYYVDGAEEKGSFIPQGGEEVVLELTLTPEEDYVFPDGSLLTVTVNGGSGTAEAGASTDTEATVRCTFLIADIIPVVTKDPTPETVPEGGSCSFVARADYAKEIEWFLTDGAEDIEAERAPRTFPGLKVSGADTEKLKLSNIPASLNGYSAYAVFSSGAGEADTDWAAILVTVEPTGSPVPTLEPRATATPYTTPVPILPVTSGSPEPTQTAAAEPDVTAPPADGHVHQYPLVKYYDADTHYNMCSCGDKVNVKPHMFVSYETRTGGRVLICPECGYSEEAAEEEKDGTVTWLLAGVGVLLAALLVCGGLYLKGRKRDDWQERL